ncbi:TIGR03086 family metal-binding protein [Actinomadura sp. SCN-SB]|uniref:TIGR03086 family metal-binding protein n=1 Tax=Actinomadura sp. SCN-SB TaxID=3373092 RepID=UPI00374FF6AF
MTASEAAGRAGDADRAEDLAAVQRYGSGLLRRAADFCVELLDGLPPLTRADLARPTPCALWNLRMLLLHLDDSLAALHEAVTDGSVRVVPPPGDPGRDLPASLRDGARRLVNVWTDADRAGGVVMVGGCAVTAGVVAGAGAVELVVHGWDISRSLGGDARIPGPLAERLLRLAPLLIPGHARAGLFGPPVPVPPDAQPTDRLVAFLGRAPEPG